MCVQYCTTVDFYVAYICDCETCLSAMPSNDDSSNTVNTAVDNAYGQTIAFSDMPLNT
jgi:hypothetical protein